MVAKTESVDPLCRDSPSWYPGWRMASGILDIHRIEADLCTRRIGRRIEWVASTSSTNDEAWARINAVDADGLVVLAEHQTAGRGQHGHTWESPRGASLLCSIALVAQANELPGSKLSLLASLAACAAVTRCTGVKPTIKWPNDLMVSGRKLGGILVEARTRRDGVQVYVIGIGINCLQQRGHLSGHLGTTATSLELESHLAIDRSGLVIDLLSELDGWLADPSRWSSVDLYDFGHSQGGLTALGPAALRDADLAPSYRL